jgi:hypothetical protein
MLSQDNPAGRRARWMERLAPFCFNIQYRPGRKMGHADFMSRIPEQTESDNESIALSQTSTFMDWDDEEENDWSVEIPGAPAWTYTGKELEEIFAENLRVIPNYFEGGYNVKQCKVCKRILPRNKIIHSCQITIFPQQYGKRKYPQMYRPEMNPAGLVNEVWWDIPKPIPRPYRVIPKRQHQYTRKERQAKRESLDNDRTWHHPLQRIGNKKRVRWDDYKTDEPIGGGWINEEILRETPSPINRRRFPQYQQSEPEGWGQLEEGSRYPLWE